NMAAEDMEILSDADERRMYREALGPAWDQLVDDGASFAALKLAAMTNIIHYVRDPETAEAYFNAGGKAPAPNRAARRTATRTRTGAATTTKPRA
ncbi:DUF7426 family protein, partial [Thermocatellispora tengchongensis]|uniref:DUF7426 family protein n=1 Tax=Thermocatellispora tengchongensis TaxID=1073253 RepID=UPI0031EFC75E